MQCALELPQLSFALAGAAAVADRRHPVLSSVLLSAENGQICLQSSDMIVSIAETAAAEVGTQGKLATNVARWNDITRALPSGPVKIESIDRGTRTKVTAGRTVVTLVSQDPADYPEQPRARDSELIAVDGAALGELLARILLTVSSDETRPTLNGALLLSDGSQVTMVSTDGHRLTKCTAALPGPKLEDPVIIPRHGIEVVRRLLAGAPAGCSWGVARGHLFARVGTRKIAVKLTVGPTFPPYDQVIPAAHNGVVEVDREALLLMLRQAAVFAPNKTNGVKLEVLSDEIRVFADNPELGAAQLSIDAKSTADRLTIGLNAGYVLEALAAVTSERVCIEVMRELDPIVVRPAGETHTIVVLMPMRI